jgi:hypothetical protein
MSGDSLSNLVPAPQHLNQIHEIDPRIRHVLINGVSFWSIHDLYKLYDRSTNPQRDWFRMKQRLKRLGYDVSANIKYYQFTDKMGRKNRATPVCTLDLLNIIVSNINIKHVLRSRDVHSDDELTDEVEVANEVAVLHPKVASFLTSERYVVEHHIVLPSRKIIDIVARDRDGGIMIVECKSALKGASLFQAIGQVLCYCAEYDQHAFATIACFIGGASEYAYRCCKALRIQILEV